MLEATVWAACRSLARRWRKYERIRVPTLPVFNGTGSSIAVPTPARFQWHWFIHRRANPGCGLWPYPGYQQTGSPGKRSAPGECDPAGFPWPGVDLPPFGRRPFSLAPVYPTAVRTPPFFDGPGSSNPRTNPGCGRCPYPGYEWTVARVSAAHPGNAARHHINNLIATTHDSERTCGTFGSKSALSPANGTPNRMPITRPVTPARSPIATWPYVARVSAAHPGGCKPAIFQWHRFIHRSANPGCGRCPYPGYQLNWMVSGAPGSKNFCTRSRSGAGGVCGAVTGAGAGAAVWARAHSASRPKCCIDTSWL